MNKIKLNKIKIGDLVMFELKQEDLDMWKGIGFIQAMNDKYFTISQYYKRITFLMIPQFESIVNYKYIVKFKILNKELKV